MDNQPGIRCGNCQFLNRPGAAFCTGCGAGLIQEAPPTVIEAARRAPPAEPRIPPAAWPVSPVVRRVPPSARPAPPTGWLGLTFNGLAWLAALAAAALISLALPLLSAREPLLDSGLYKTSLRSQEVYQRFPDLFAEQMLLSQDRLGRQAQIDFTGVGLADWKFLAQELFPVEWLQSQVERLLDEIFAAAAPGAPPPALKIPLAEITQRLSGESGMRIYKQVIQTKRECGFDDFFEIVDWIDQDPAARLPVCNIPADLSEFAALVGGYDNGDAMIQDLLKELPGQLPAELALSDFMALPMHRVAQWLRLGSLAGWGALVLAGLALLFTFLAPLGRTLTGGLLLWGLPLSLAGATGLLEALLLPWAVGGLIVGAFRDTLTPGLTRVLLQMGEAVASAGATTLAWWAGGLLALGVLLWGAAALIWGYHRFAHLR